jgi:DNA-binding transcriptional regulator YbjK
MPTKPIKKKPAASKLSSAPTVPRARRVRVLNAATPATADKKSPTKRNSAAHLPAAHLAPLHLTPPHFAQQHNAPTSRDSNTQSPASSFSFPAALAAQPVPSNTRDRILYAAVEILNNEGFGALTQTRVAEKASVRQSHITYYFPARNDLLRETAAYGCNVMLEMLSGSIDEGTLTLDTMRDFLIADLSDRRFARLMCALIVASDEDERIKLWLASFEDINRQRLLDTFQKLGLKITLEDVEFFHSAYVGAVMLDLGESSETSLARAQRVLARAIEHLLASSVTASHPTKPNPSSSQTPRATRTSHTARTPTRKARS